MRLMNDRTPPPRDAHDGPDALPERLRALLANASDGVWVTTGGRIVFWNRAAEAMLGHRARDVVGRRCAGLLTGRDKQRRALCDPGCDEAQPFDCDFGVATRTRRGEAVWLEISTVALPRGTGGDESAPLVVHVFHDATRRRSLVTRVREEAGPPAAAAARLTPREAEVLRLMAQGLGTAAVAERLRVSRATIRNHVQNIFAKLKVHNRVAAVVEATRRGLV